MRRDKTRRGLASVKTSLGRVPRAAIVAAAILLAFVAVAALAMTRDAGTYNARIGSYRQDDPYRLVVYVSLGFADPVVGYDAREDAGQIKLTIHARNRDFGPGTFKQLTASLATPVLITLNAPLGNRTVVDASGGVVPRTTQDPLCGRTELDGLLSDRIDLSVR